jgi:penicillin amidase
VVSGARTRSGRPLLANDPHLALTVPSLWFLARLEGGGVDVTGATIPGLPALLAGRTAHVAWGVTDAYADTQDLFVETPAPGGDPEAYLAGDRVERFERRRERIAVRRLLRDRADDWSWRVGRHGPVLNDLFPELGAAPLLSLSWTGATPSEDLLAFHGLLRARNADEVDAALDLLGAPTLGFLYATAEGDIGYRLAGRLPLRRGGDGRRPGDGRSERGAWLGFVPADELPRARNPEAGFLVAANNAVAPGGRYPFVIGGDPLAPHRAARIAERLAERDAWDVAETARLQMDRFSRRAAGLVPLIVAAARDAAAGDARARRAWERLRDWNREADTGEVGPALFAEVFRLARQLALRDEMPADVWARFSLELAADTKLDRLLADAGSPVWDDRETPGRRETRDDVLARAFLGAVQELGGRLGGDVDGWTWGRLSILRFEHPFAYVPLVGGLFRLKETPFPGLADTVNPAYASPLRRWEVRAGASLRHVSDFGEAGVSRWVLTSGASGRIGNAHFLDQAPLWLEGRLIGIGREPEGVEGRVRLVPLEGR